MLGQRLCFRVAEKLVQCRGNVGKNGGKAVSDLGVPAQQEFTLPRLQAVGAALNGVGQLVNARGTLHLLQSLIEALVDMIIKSAEGTGCDDAGQKEKP